MAKSGRGESASRAQSSRAGHSVHGWTVLAHPLFLDQLERLMAAVAAERAKRKINTANQKVLAGIVRYAFDEIPKDPTRSVFRQGTTLAPEHKHWHRARFANGRFRLFFRYRTDARVIVLAWVNDEQTLRTRGARNDAYAVFGRMLDGGNPPDDWNALVKASTDRGTSERLRRLVKAGSRRGS